MNMKNIINVAILFAAFVLVGNIQALAIDEDELLFNPVKEVKDGTVLSVIDCVSLGFKNSPKIKRQKYY